MPVEDRGAGPPPRRGGGRGAAAGGPRRGAGGRPGRSGEVWRGVEPLVSIERLNPHVVREVRLYIRAISERLAAGKGIWVPRGAGAGKTTLGLPISKAGE